ncbi:unnamed protein product, partial [Prorocentrum cordatum]
ADKLEEDSGGDKKNVTKSKLLMGYLADPELGESLMKVVNTICFTETVEQESAWTSKKQMKDAHSSSAAEEMISEGRIEA